jgi:4-amino-4-deoxychorismate lyase
MCRLLETIKILDGRAFNLEGHNRRANAARRLLFGTRDELDLGEFIQPERSAPPGSLTRCRVLFRQSVERVEYHPYRLPALSSLRVVRADDIEYRFKFENRAALAALLALRGTCDDVLIVRRGLVTDTTISNVVFFDGERYATPAEPLLEGTKRAILLEAGLIEAVRITVDDLGRYRKVYLINSLIDLEDDVSVPLSAVRT